MKVVIRRGGGKSVRAFFYIAKGMFKWLGIQSEPSLFTKQTKYTLCKENICFPIWISAIVFIKPTSINRFRLKKKVFEYFLIFFYFGKEMFTIVHDIQSEPNSVTKQSVYTFCQGNTHFPVWTSAIVLVKPTPMKWFRLVIRQGETSVFECFFFIPCNGNVPHCMWPGIKCEAGLFTKQSEYISLIHFPVWTSAIAQVRQPQWTVSG